MFPDALNYFSFVVALLCAVPLVIGLYQYIGYVSSYNSSTYTRADFPLRLAEFFIVAMVLYRVSSKS